jgi:hypothetical protein
MQGVRLAELTGLLVILDALSLLFSTLIKTLDDFACSPFLWMF